MSELKVHTIYTPMDDVAHDEKGKILEGQEVYLKSEVDGVLAEKDNEIAELKDKLRHYPMMVALLENDKKEIEELKKKLTEAK